MLLVTPTSFVALLKVVAYGWMQFKLAENAELIRDQAVTLQTRLGTFTGHITSMGKKLEASVKSYNAAVASLETRVAPVMRKISELGAEASRKHEEPDSIDTTPRELKAIEGLQPQDDTTRENDPPRIETRPQ